MKKWLVTKNKKKDDYYVSLAISGGYGKGYERSISIGNLSKLQEQNEDAMEIIKQLAASLPLDADKDYVKSKLAEAFKLTKVEIGTYNIGIELIYQVIKDIDLFKNLNVGKENKLKKFSIS
ncbi:hypothetical protein [Mycoplasma seminis]|uniref:Uncharacterized protein n=1 Tax=Mycoplasma seminis TaxID=512749 RepID=A0ABY9HB90_9MOLU|nr:hypothetical protein [Mycoplasma seminis]WLP85869.1 hypothetical protein Q8852_01845 [Mycoplasma seminis]